MQRPLTECTAVVLALTFTALVVLQCALGGLCERFTYSGGKASSVYRAKMSECVNGKWDPPLGRCPREFASFSLRSLDIKVPIKSTRQKNE